MQPLLEADQPSSCAKCHAGGLELDDLLREDACESMACLVDAGLVDLENPERSVILSFIERAEPQSELITDEVIAEEYAAFLSWIEHESECQNCTTAVCDGREPSSCDRKADLESTLTADTDPGDCNRATIERLFRGTVYDNRGRCSPCHFREEDTKTPEEIRWLTSSGDCLVASLASLRAVEELGYINTETPEESLLIQKPLAESDGGLPHGGHDKFVAGDKVHRAFLHFATRYAACENSTEWSAPSARGEAGE